jgi:hypothetical protein
MPGQLPIGTGYFTVYRANANLIGRIPSVELRNQIVRTYTLAEGMMDTIRLYNSLAESAGEFAGAYSFGSNELRIAQNTGPKRERSRSE